MTTRYSYIDTTDDKKVIRVPGNESDGPIEVVNAPANLEFNLTNTLTKSAMKEVEAVAKRNGLKLTQKNRMAVTFKQ